ncbi:hypothetical protein C1H46_019923 [Malus baccata]|uniref:DUF4283 domain-containing protein n=1 Tax=Malus baccata TaxID=106549 RepID=A0A540M6Q3_MALBA|nr:hypothetical protein C1H46_019923 [Malus baccata]
MQLPSWANPFPVPLPGEQPVVVERAMGTFTMERGVTRVSTSLCSALNVEHIQSKILMGMMFRQHLEARLIKWKLGMLWKSVVKNTFCLDHYGRRFFVIEFADSADLEAVMDNCPWYIRDQIFHLERWTTIGDVLRVDDITLGLNGLFVKVLVEDIGGLQGNKLAGEGSSASGDVIASVLALEALRKSARPTVDVGSWETRF